MKFKVGDRVVVTKGTEDHGIPEGTVCEIERVRAQEHPDPREFPYVVRRMLVDEDNALGEDEIELVED